VQAAPDLDKARTFPAPPSGGVVGSGGLTNLRGMLNVLTLGQESFVQAYVAGEPDTLGNGTRAYLSAFPNCTTDQSGAVQACRLLKMPKVRARISELRAEAERACRARLRSWWALAPDAQRTLEQAAAGSFDPMPEAPHGVRAEAIRSGVRSAQEILNRAEGTPQQLHELRITAGIMVAVAGPGGALQAGQEGPGLQNGHYVPPGELETVQPARITGASGEKWTDVGEAPHELDSEHDRQHLDPTGQDQGGR